MNPSHSVIIKVLIISGVATVTLGIHYGWLIEPFFGHVHWIHVIHGRFCYIPIVIAAAWFGLRGGVLAAAGISLLLIPYLIRSTGGTADISSELAEIIFYFALGILIGGLVDREFKARRRHQEAELQVEQSQKLSLVGQIAAGVDHEVKNPLATIKGAADILTEDTTSQTEREEFKQIMQNEIKRIDTTVTEFLEFARPRETTLEHVNLTEVVEASLRQIEAHARQQDIQLQQQLDGTVLINGDPEKLHQMLMNLVLNAIQASAPGDTVEVSLSISGGLARIRVADSGTGIKDSDLAHIYEPFFTTKPTGTGLGLAVVKGIIDAHGGHIHYEPGTDMGTVVTVALPLSETD